MTDSQTTNDPPLAAPTGSPRKVPLKRRLSRKQADRLRKLIDSCGMMTADGKIEIFPGSHTFGGPPLKNLTSELSLLLSGFSTDRPCRDVL